MLHLVLLLHLFGFTKQCNWTALLVKAFLLIYRKTLAIYNQNNMVNRSGYIFFLWFWSAVNQ